jgi:hypothetical protein
MITAPQSTIAAATTASEMSILKHKRQRFYAAVAQQESPMSFASNGIRGLRRLQVELIFARN